MPSVEKEERARHFLELFRDAEDAFGQEIEQMLIDDTFYHGDQWSSEDEAALDEVGAPHLTFNITKPKGRFVNGYMQTNRFDITAFTASGGTDEISTVYTKALKSQLYSQHYEAAMNAVLTDAIVRSRGWMYCLPSYHDDLTPTITFERLNPLSVFPDPKYESLTLNDADRVHIVTLKTLDEIKDEFGVSEDELRSLVQLVYSDEGRKYRLHERAFKENDIRGYTAKGATPVLPSQGGRDWEIKVIDTWYRSRADYWVVLLPDGRTQIVWDENEMNMLLSTGAVTDYLERTKDIVSQIIHVGNLVLHESINPFHDDIFPVIPLPFSFDSGRSYSLVRDMRDPQNWINKMISKFAHAVNVSPHAGLIYEEDSLVDPELIQNKGSIPGIHVVYKYNRPQPQPYPPSGPQTALAQIIGQLDEIIDKISGITVSMMGFAANADESGKAAALRQSSGQTMLWEFIENTRIFRHQLGRLMISYFREFYTPEDLFRVTGDQNALTVPPLDLSHGEYKIVIDERPSGPTNEIIEFTSLADLVHQGMEISPLTLLKKAPIHDKQEAIEDFMQWTGFKQYLEQQQQQQQQQPA